jgi:hypothetical protein
LQAGNEIGIAAGQSAAMATSPVGKIPPIKAPDPAFDY